MAVQLVIVSVLDRIGLGAVRLVILAITEKNSVLLVRPWAAHRILIRARRVYLNEMGGPKVSRSLASARGPSAISLRI